MHKLVVFAAALAAASIGYTELAERRMSNDLNRLVSITDAVRPVCIGRFIVDVPIDAEIVFGPARLPVEIWRKAGEGEDFSAAVRNAVAESESRRWLAYGPLKAEGSLVGKVIDGFAPNQKIVFGVGRSDGAYYNVQSLIKLGSDLYVQEYEAFGEGSAYLEDANDAREIAKRLRSRAEDEVPNELGVCVDGAFLIDPPHRYMVEAVSIGIRLKEFADVHISIEMTKKDVYVESDALEPRLNAAKRDAVAQGKAAWYSRIKFLSKGRRRVGNWDGFEVGARMPSQSAGEEHHEFEFLSQGEPKNPLLPVLDIQLQTGVKDNVVGGVKAGISDAEALYLWEKVLGSIRPRPVHQSDRSPSYIAK
jgi:hypothetical protein